MNRLLSEILIQMNALRTYPDVVAISLFLIISGGLGLISVVPATEVAQGSWSGFSVLVSQFGISAGEKAMAATYFLVRTIAGMLLLIKRMASVIAFLPAALFLMISHSLSRGEIDSLAALIVALASPGFIILFLLTWIPMRLDYWRTPPAGG